MTSAGSHSVQELLRQPSLRWVFCGDSITQGALHTRGYQSWTQLVEQHLQETLGRSDQVFTTAVSGDTAVSIVNPNSGTRTPGVLSSAEERIRDLRPDLVTVMIGMNDCALGVPQSDYRAALGDLARRIRAWGALPVLATSQPIRGLDERRLEYPRYMEIVREIAAELDVLLVDNLRHWEEARLTAHPTLWSDAIHPSARGHRHLAQHFVRTLGLLGDSDPLARAAGEHQAGLNLLAVSGTEHKLRRHVAPPSGGSDENSKRLRAAYAATAEGPHSSRATLVLGDTSPLAFPVDEYLPTRAWFRHLEEVRRFELGNPQDYFHGLRLRSLQDAADAMASFRHARIASCVLIPTAADVDGPASTRWEQVSFDLAEQVSERGAAGVLVLRQRTELDRKSHLGDLARRLGFAVLDLTDVLPSGRDPSALLPGRAGMIDVDGARADLEAADRALALFGWNCPTDAVGKVNALAAAVSS